MYTLKNDQMTIKVLDPVADSERMGTRYCWGGYIFSVADEAHGNLMSGPTYPDAFNTFDGQGIPDAFNLMPLRNPVGMRGGHVATDTLALILGIGIVDIEKNEVVEPCVWQVEAGKTVVEMTTEHEFRGFQVKLWRTVTLNGRTVSSYTQVENHHAPLAFRWFPHPFYPQPDGDALCKFNFPVDYPENPGFVEGDDGFISRNSKDWSRGYYQALDHDAESPLVVLQKHPKLGLVAATTSYVPDFFPIWGNANTFSWEPFLEQSLAPGQAYAWWIDYEF